MKLLTKNPETITQIKNDLINDFNSFITNYDLGNTWIEFKRKSLPEKMQNKKANIYFTPDAFLKTNTLIKKAEKEIAWHGTVRRESETDFWIDDILIYPQEVSAGAVLTDDAKYPLWLNEQPDEVFNKIRMQGHSHVNMGTSPSSTDEKYYSDLLKNLTEEDYYIFFIMNKKNDIWVNIYDIPNNVIYEKEDINIFKTLSDGLLVSDWYDEQAKEFVSEIHSWTNTKWSGFGDTAYAYKETNQQANTVVPINQKNTKQNKKQKDSEKELTPHEKEVDDYCRRHFGKGWNDPFFHTKY